jgi:hypothetical protein
MRNECYGALVLALRARQRVQGRSAIGIYLDSRVQIERLLLLPLATNTVLALELQRHRFNLRAIFA